MDADVRRVRELVRHPVAGALADPLCFLDRRKHTALRICEHQLGAVRCERAFTLFAHRLGDAEDQAIAARGCDLSEPDPCIARRRLDDRASGAEDAALLGVEDHAERGAILD